MHINQQNQKVVDPTRRCMLLNLPISGCISTAGKKQKQRITLIAKERQCSRENKYLLEGNMNI